MADLEKIHKLEDEVKMLKSHLVKYRKLFMDDGMIDQDELQVLDGLDTIIQKIEKEIERRVSELSWSETAQYHAENLMEGAGEVVETVIETVSEIAEEVVDFVTGSEELQDNTEEAQEQTQTSETEETEENSDTENEAESSSEDTGSYPYFSHPDWENVKVSYGANAVKLNKNADRLLKSILSSVGLKSCHVTSTIRTYADQARINYEQNSESQIKQWYGSEVHATWVRYKAEGRSTADYAAYLEERDKKRGKVLSKHLSNLCLDVTPVDSKYSNKLKELKPVSGSGVKTYLVEKGCVHTEFTFPVTGASGGSGGHGGTVMEEPNPSEQQSSEQNTSESNTSESSASTGNTSTTDNSNNEQILSTTSKISSSVGNKGKNKPEDVVLVKKLLNKFGANLNEDPEADAALTEAIKKFQRDYRGSTNPDGRVDAGGGTWNSLLGIGRIKGDLLKVSQKYGVEPAVILAIQSIESGGNGFLSDGRPKILFEGHIFWKQLEKAGKNPSSLQTGNEDIIYPKWVRTHYVGGAGEYDRLERAKKIDKLAALMSASWGEFQIMGFNHATVGYSDVESFVDAMHAPGSNQLSAVMEFLKKKNLIRHVQGSSKDWAALAKGYNGPGYAQNKYDVKLAAAYDRYSKIL